MTRPLRTLRPLGALAAPLVGAVLAVACLGGQGWAGDAASADGRSAGPVALYQQSLMQRQPTAADNEFARQRSRLESRQQAQLPLDRRDAVVRRAQSSLEQLGFAPGAVDGAIGSKTRTAIRAFQRDRGLRAEGQLTAPLLRELGSALNEQRRVVVQQAAERPDRRSADRDAPGELRSERNGVELVEGPATASAERTTGTGPNVGLIATAQAATPEAPAPLAGGEAEAAIARPGYTTDGEYGLDDAVVESWAIFTSVSGAMLRLLETRVAELAD